MTTTNIISIINVNINGRDGGGPVTATGVKVGDVIISVYNTGDNAQANGYFQPVVSTDDSIEQVVGSNFTGQNFSFVLLRQ